MIEPVHGKRFARGDAGAHSINVGTRIVPVRAEVEPCRAKVVGGRLVADLIDSDALVICEQQHIPQPRHLPIQHLDTEAGGTQQLLHRIAMFPQFAVFYDDGRAKHSWIKPVIAHAAPPGIEDKRVTCDITAFGDADQFPDVLHMGDRYGTFLPRTGNTYQVREIVLSRRVLCSAARLP